MLDLNTVLSRIIDLRYSKIDETKSDPKKGRFFGQKVYYSTKGKKLADCPWWFAFCHQDREGQEPNKWIVLMGYDFVEPGDKFIPDGVPLNAEGHYQVGDVVLMKQPMRLHLEQKLERYKMEENQAQAIKDKFKAEAKRDGVQVNEEEIAKMLGMTT